MARRTRLDEEVLELLADEPELLAIADAFAETQARPRRIRPVGAVAAAVLVAAVVLALAFWPGGRSSGISGNTAYAAVGGELRLVTIRSISGATPLTLRLDRVRDQVTAIRHGRSFVLVASELPPAATSLAASTSRRLGPGAGPLLSLLTEYPGIAKAGHLEAGVPVLGYGRLRWVRYRSSLGYEIEVGLEQGTLKPVAVRDGRTDVARSILLSYFN
jgi:hypothetical protein